MKTSYFLLLTVCAGSVYAAPPTLTDLSYGSNYTPYSTYAAPVSANQKLDKLQNDVTQLKTRVGKLESAQPQGFTSPGQVDSGHTAKPTAGEKGHYEYAYSILKNGGYNQAIAEFQSIIKTYPNGEYADNSQYWTGEALLKKGDKQGAMRAFDNVVYAYSRSPKVPDALLKLGMTQASLGNKAKAREYYDYLIGSYPGTPSANAAYTKRAGL